jgi:hypothetical protein
MGLLDCNEIMIYEKSKHQAAKITKKMPMFEQLKNQVLVNPKIFLTLH